MNCLSLTAKTARKEVQKIKYPYQRFFKYYKTKLNPKTQHIFFKKKLTTLLRTIVYPRSLVGFQNTTGLQDLPKLSNSGRFLLNNYIAPTKVIEVRPVFIRNFQSKDHLLKSPTNRPLPINKY